jgi:hypothetical protein
VRGRGGVLCLLGANHRRHHFDGNEAIQYGPPAQALSFVCSRALLRGIRSHLTRMRTSGRPLQLLTALSTTRREEWEGIDFTDIGGKKADGVHFYSSVLKELFVLHMGIAIQRKHSIMANVCVCACVRVCYLHSSIHSYIHTCTYIHTYILHTYIRINIHTYIYTYKHTYIRIYVYTYVYTHIKVSATQRRHSTMAD